jgi:uncharacterized caspase-like protein/regulator of sirC expression with transglutaminase-like and TPR domain
MRVLGCLALVVLGGAAFSQRGLVHDAIKVRGSVALVVGNARYHESPLVNPLNDARAVGDTLKELGFAVELSLNADYRGLGTSIDRFVSRLRRGDVAVFYYAGHGMQIDGENYLIPVDFDAPDETSAKYRAYPLARLLEGMERADAKLNIVILDACRNNPYSRSRAGSGGLAPMGAAAGTFVALATAPGKTASDNARGSNGLFTSHLLACLREPGLNLDAIFNRTRERVFQASNQKQLPWSQSSVIGTFYFRPLAQEKNTAAIAASPDFQKAVQQARSGETAASIDTLSEAIRKNPDNVDAFHERAMSYAANGQFQRAIDDFGHILRRDAKNVDALIGRGACYVEISDFDTAVADLTQAIKLNASENAYFNRGLSYAGLRKHQQALADYGRVISQRPKWPSAWYNRAIVHGASGDFQAAISDYTEAIRLRPDYAAAYANRGVSRAESGDLSRALNDLDEARRLKPDDAAIWNNRGLVLLGLDKLPLAIAAFDEAIRIDPLYGMAYRNRAEARRKAGDESGASQDLRRARELGSTASLQ